MSMSSCSYPKFSLPTLSTLYPQLHRKTKAAPHLPAPATNAAAEFHTVSITQ